MVKYWGKNFSVVLINLDVSISRQDYKLRIINESVHAIKSGVFY